jgi:GNAT superfamily N-acetyltransferase
VRHGDLRQSRQGRAASRAPQGALIRRVEVVRTYLELDDPSRFRKPDRAPSNARVDKRSPCPVETYRRLYRDVGGMWYWHDRLEWSDAQLADHLARGDVGVWELTVDGASAGYFELQRQDNDSVEIVYFGLTPEFIGRGLGGFLLGRAVEEAWAMGARRVWLHTCTLDSERALPNYKARGFREFRTQRLEVEIDGRDVVSERVLSD